MKNSLQNSQLIIGSFILMLTLFISLPVFSATYYSRQSGNWNDVNSWSLVSFGGVAAASVPGAGDDVIIDRSFITIDASHVTVASVLITNISGVGGTNAQLLVSNGRKLTVTGNMDVMAINVAKANTLKLINDFSELEVLGNLTFSRSANNAQTTKNNFILKNESKVTVHGNYVINNLGGATYLSQYDLSLSYNAQFICKSNVIWTISGLGNYSMGFGNTSAAQIDGTFTINHNGEGRLILGTGSSAQLTIDQDLNVDVTDVGKFTMQAFTNSPYSAGCLIHVEGDLNVDHSDGRSFGLEANYSGEIRIDGDMDVSWTGSTQINTSPAFTFKLVYGGIVNIGQSLIVNMNEPNAALLFDIQRDAKLNIGTNNGLLEESATINIVNGASMQAILERRGEINIYGDFVNNISIEDDLRFELNASIYNTNIGRAKFKVDGNWNITKNEGDAFILTAVDACDVIVGGNFTVNSTNHQLGNFEDEEITVGNIATFEVGGAFEYSMNDPNQNVNLNVNLSGDAIMKTGSYSGLGTSLTLNDGNAISVSLVDNAVWETSGDFNIKCIDGANSSTVDLTNSSALIVGKDLVLNNTQNNNNIAVHSVLTSLIDVNGDIDMTNLSAQNLGLITVSDDSKLELEGSLVHNVAPNNYGSLIVENNGVIEFNGMDAQIIPSSSGAGTDVTELGNVVLNSFSINVPQFTVPADASMKSLTVNNLNEIEISSDAGLTVQNSITNNGVVYVENNASLVQTNGGANTNAGNGTYHVKRTGKNVASVFNVWSSPIGNASLTSVFDGGNPCDMYVFEPSVQNWSYDFSAGYSTTCSGNAVTFQAGNVIAGGDGIMDVARGYYAPGSANSTRTFTGEVNNGDITMAINTTALGVDPNWMDDDWNLVGNPYPSSLDATAFWTANAVNNARITNGIYYWDDADPNAAANQNSDYAYWNLAGGVSSGNSNKIPNGHIASGQGFWVYANANTDLVFNNSMRSNTNDQFFKQENRNHSAWISFTTPSFIENNILVGFNQEATDTVDLAYDAHKLEINPHVYFASTYGAEDFVIQSLKPIEMGGSKVIPLVLSSDEYGVHTIKEYKRENLSNNITIYVHDKYQGTMHDLSTGDFSITLNANQEYRARFELVINFEMGSASGMGTKADITSISETGHTDFKVHQSTSEIMVENFNGNGAQIQVIDISGKMLIEREIDGSSNTFTINWSGLASGSYIITIGSDKQHFLTQQLVKL